MSLFGPPNIEKMKARGNIKGLVNALSDINEATRKDAASALEVLGWKPEQQATEAIFNKALEKNHSETVKWLLENGAFFDAEEAFKDTQSFDLRIDLRIAILIFLGLDPWWYEDTQERLELIQLAREAIRPKGKEFTELLIKVLREETDPNYAFYENKALAAISLGILNADFRLFQDSGLIEQPLFEYKRKIGDRVIEKTLSLHDFLFFRANHGQGEKAAPHVIEALRHALTGVGDTTLDYSHKIFPCLDVHISLYMSAAQARTLAGELRKGESKEPFYLKRDSKGFAFASALSLVLIGDKSCTRQMVELGFESCVGSYERGFFYKLAYDLGLKDIPVELAKTYVQCKDINGAFKEFKKGYLEGKWALNCLSVMNDLEMLIPNLEGDDKNVLEAAIEQLRKTV